MASRAQMASQASKISSRAAANSSSITSLFDPAWDKGCSGCTGFVNALGDLSLLDKCDTKFVVVSRAPLAKLDAHKAQKGWIIAWFSSFGSDFNYDFYVTLDPKVA